MKKIILLLALTCSLFARGQVFDLSALDSVGSTTTPINLATSDSYVWLVVEGVNTFPKSRRASLFQLKQLIGGQNIDDEFAGRTITRDDWDALAGTTYTTLEDVFFPAEPPTASLTVTAFGSTSGANRTVEITTAGTQPGTANWTAGRQPSTGLITSITAAGQSQTFNQPPQGGTENGTQAFTITNNTNVTINLTVVSESGNATDNISITWRSKRYWGVDADGTVSDAELIAGNGELSNSRAKTFTVNPSNEFVYYAYPQSLGALTSITVNGFESIASFTQSTFSHTNASGGVVNYFLYLSNNQFTQSSTVITQ